MFKLTRSRICAAAVAAATVASMAIGGTAAAATSNPTVISVGHVDALDVHYDGGELGLTVTDDTVTPSVERSPADVILQLKPGAVATIPANPAYSFLGAAGAQSWILPQSNDPALLWPGWDTGDLPSGTFKGNKVAFRLVDVAGPGRFALFQVDAFGSPVVLFNSGNTLPQQFDVPVHSHAHANWAFSALGRYTLTFEVTADLNDGTPVSTGRVAYTFHVGDIPPPADEVSVVIEGLKSSYEVGETATLLAVKSPASTSGHFHWFAKCGDALDFAAFPGGDSTSFVVTEDMNGCQFKAVLNGKGHVVLAETSPVTLRVKGAALATTTALSVSPEGTSVHGAPVTLTAIVLPTEATGRVEFFDGPNKIGTAVVSGGSASYSQGVFGATEHSFTATFVPSDPEAFAASTSEIVSHTVTGEISEFAAYQNITTTIVESGALVISVADHQVTLPNPTLDAAANRLTTAGAINPVTVTDTRSYEQGWTVSGQVTDFVNAADSTKVIDKAGLGWTPRILTPAPGQQLLASAEVRPYVAGGLGASQTLATAAAGKSRGTATLGADILLSAPTTTVPGTYSAVLTLTVS